MRPYIIRKMKCGCWSIIKVIDTPNVLRFREVALLETFGDVLVLLNCGSLNLA